MQINQPEPKKLVWPKELDTFLEADITYTERKFHHANQPT
nr:MAG TPA: hypothetical protein [Caudoviricetes sp.]